MNQSSPIYERRLLDVKRTPLLISYPRKHVADPVVFTEEIHVRVGTIRSLRHKILASRPPTHWGINE